MVNFVPGFISDEVWHWGAEQDAEEARLKAIHRASKAEVEAGLKAWEAAHPRPVVTVAHGRRPYRACRQGRRLRPCRDRRRPRRHSTTRPPGLDGVEDYPNLFAELIRRGWSDANLAKLAGGNVLRVLRRAEAVSPLDEGRAGGAVARSTRRPPNERASRSARRSSRSRRCSRIAACCGAPRRCAARSSIPAATCRGSRRRRRRPA